MLRMTMLRITLCLLLGAIAGAAGAAAQETQDGEANGTQARADLQESIGRWMRQLDDRRAAAREEATEALIEIGAPAVPALLEAVERKRGEVKERSTRILRELERRAAAELEKHGAKVQRNDAGWVRYVSFRHHRDTGPVEDPGAEHLAAVIGGFAWILAP